MTTRTPFVSVIVPTSNRPELLRYCLESLALQTFSDFEVIVSDNHTGKPCKEVFDQFADGRFRYVTPPSPLAMHDNWEFASGFVTGEYVAVLIDKTVLRPSALEVMHAILERKSAEIVSWWNEGYVLVDEDRCYDKGIYAPGFEPCDPYYFDPKKELVRRFSLDVRRGREGVHYHWGKICFGAYHQNLIRRIKEAIGRLFYPFSPDYTSMLAALAYAESAVDAGQPLLLSFNTKISTGRLAQEQDEYAFSFVKSVDPSLRVLDTLPLKGLYASSHNVVATDYVFMKEKVGEPMLDLMLNTRNLILRAREDLDERTIWQDESRKTEQYDIWEKYFGKLSLQERIYIYLQLCRKRLPRLSIVRDLLKTLLKTMLGVSPRLREMVTASYYHHHISGPVIKVKTFDSIIEAAKYADDYYKGLCPREQ